MPRDLFASLPSLSERQLRRQLEHAIAAGGNDPRLLDDPDFERRAHSRILMALAGRRVFEVTQLASHVQARLNQAAFDPDDLLSDTLAERLHSTVGAAIRFTARALEAHAREHSYDPEAWLEHAQYETDAVLARASRPDATCPTVLGELREAVDALFDAIAVDGIDRMAVPEHLASALGHWLALYLAARRLAGH